MRFFPFIIVCIALAVAIVASLYSEWAWLAIVPLAVLFWFGIADLFQVRHAVRRNYPVTGRFRWFFYWLRPFLRQYIVESETEGRPFNHEQRQLVYRRAANESSVEPFGSHVDNNTNGFEWIAHSIGAVEPAPIESLRVMVGGPDCTKPYSASVLNISAMSYGSLSGHAIEALNRGAAKGQFYHDTGEGGVSKFHKAGSGDLVWELGSGYFGCRTADGNFDAQRFEEVASLDQIKMIEIKLSQGAKPGHGGLLPGAKVTQAIAETRGVPVGETVVSPPYHKAFSTPLELVQFIAKLRKLSGGKPVGFKLCMGPAHEFLSIIKAIVETGIKPDFIVVDGAEGGTGAAPMEFQDHIGSPLRDGLILARNALVAAGLKEDIRLAVSGKIVSGYGMAAAMALGADWINSARGFMFALGCVQSLHCHNNTCPTGIATQDPGRERGLVIPDKAERVYHFQHNTLHALSEVIAAAGASHPYELDPDRLMIKTDAMKSVPASQYYDLLEKDELLNSPNDTYLAQAWARANSAHFG
ncbi:FMN-binding glutamate synthase family protein [Hirschia litorea]|uniref:FMN-binding glutamate synthase family protein n=1 Tax=Hirschia litorea TaxID=1199156 RepID=A0ABW2IM15_9PROT